jgi:hypothetical protein
VTLSNESEYVLQHASSISQGHTGRQHTATSLEGREVDVEESGSNKMVEGGEEGRKG